MHNKYDVVPAEKAFKDIVVMHLRQIILNA